MSDYCYNPKDMASGAVWKVVKGIIEIRSDGWTRYSTILQSRDNDRVIVNTDQWGYYSKTSEEVFNFITKEWFPGTPIETVRTQ